MSINLYDVNGDIILDYDSCIYYIDSDQYRPLSVQSCRLVALKVGKARGCNLIIKLDTFFNNDEIQIPGMCVGNKDYKFARLFNIAHGKPIYNPITIEDKSIDFDRNEFIRQWRDCLKSDPSDNIILNVSNVRFDIIYDAKSNYVFVTNHRAEFLMKEFGLTDIRHMLNL